MKRFAALLAILAAVPAAAQDQAPAPLSLEQTLLLRCSATFAIAGYNQREGVPMAAAVPDLQARSREYFVRAGARLMDELKWSREELTQRLWAEVRGLQQGAIDSGDAAGFMDRALQPCLASLEASKL